MPAGRPPTPIMDRIKRKIKREDGHWLWLGSLAKNGNARINDKGYVTPVGRVTYAYHTGYLPPSYLWVVPTCGRKDCVNPEHLQLMSHGEAQMFGGNMKGQKNKTHCRRGHELTEENSWRFERPNGVKGRACRVCINLKARERYARRKKKDEG